MKHTLQIQLRSSEGAVLRTLGMIERRGFRLESCTVGEAGGDGREMRICVSSDRSVDLLQRQLERLHDVLWAERVKTDAQPAARWAGQAMMRH